MYTVGGISNERESLIWANHQISLTNNHVHAKFIDNIDMKYHTEIWYIRQKKSQIVCYDLKDQFRILSNEQKIVHDASLITNFQCKIQIYAKNNTLLFLSLHYTGIMGVWLQCKSQTTWLFVQQLVCYYAVDAVCGSRAQISLKQPLMYVNRPGTNSLILKQGMITTIMNKI